MSRPAKILRLGRWSALAAAVAAIGLAAAAWAYFTATGTSSASAVIGALSAPSGISTQQNGNDVSISWNAATLSSGGAADGYRVKRSDGTTVCGSPTLVTALTCTDASVPGGTYTYTVTAVYRSFTKAGTSGSVALLTAPTVGSKPSNPSASVAPSFTLSGGGGSGYQCQIDGGSFAACSSPRSLSSLSDGSHTFKVHAVQGGSTGPDGTYTWTVDTAAPSISGKPANPSNTTSPSFTFAHTEAGYTFKCQLDGGGFSACTSPKSYSGVGNGSHTFQVQAIASDGSATSAASYTWLLDTTPPTDALSLAAGASGAYMNAAGTTLYYKGSASGSFKLVDAVADSSSGPASATFPVLSASGWTHSAETVSTPASGPYTSSTVSWTASPANPSGYTVTSKDAAGNTSTGASPTFVSDATIAGAGALSVNGTAASGSDPVSYTSSTAFPINSRGDYTETQTASQSGLTSSTLTVQSETASGGGCGAPGSGGPFTTATTITSTTQPSGFLTGFCYLYTLTGTDNVGNTASITTTVVVDNSNPTTPTLSFAGLSSNAFYSSANNTLYFRPASGGAFTVTASSTAPSGIASYAFSSLSSNNFTGTQNGAQDAYTFGSSATQPGSSPTVSATSKSGKVSGNASYNLLSDTTAPSGGSVSYTDGYFTAASVPVTLADGTDSGSGVNSSSEVLLRASATLSGGSCGSYGAFISIATNPNSPYTDTSLADGHCYKYEYQASDNVGNTATNTSSNQAKVDTSAPAAALTFPVQGGSYAIGNGGSSSWNSKSSGACGSQQICGTASDSGSGLASVQISVLGPNGKYWDGSLSSGHANFTATTQTWVTVSGTSNWSQSWSNSTFNGVTGSYTVSARASDLAGTTGAAVSASFTTS